MSPVHHVGKSKKRMNERLRFVTFKVQCWVRTEREEALIPGFGFASDISETGIGIYLDRKINVGSPVKITLEDEASQPFPGVVAWSQRFSLEQKFHGHHSLDHRLGVRFTFESEGERQRYIMFFNELRRRVTIFAKEQPK